VASERVGAAMKTASVRSSSSGRGQAELNRTTGLLELEEMGATAVPPPSREELGIEGNEEVARLRPGVGLDVGVVLDSCCYCGLNCRMGRMVIVAATIYLFRFSGAIVLPKIAHLAR
jgi:hypothetical protein